MPDASFRPQVCCFYQRTFATAHDTSRSLFMSQPITYTTRTVATSPAPPVSVPSQRLTPSRLSPLPHSKCESEGCFLVLLCPLDRNLRRGAFILFHPRWLRKRMLFLSFFNILFIAPETCVRLLVHMSFMLFYLFLFHLRRTYDCSYVCFLYINFCFKIANRQSGTKQISIYSQQMDNPSTMFDH